VRAGLTTPAGLPRLQWWPHSQCLPWFARPSVGSTTQFWGVSHRGCESSSCSALTHVVTPLPYATTQAEELRRRERRLMLEIDRDGVTL
jgi:hypothetical protein